MTPEECKAAPEHSYAIGLIVGQTFIRFQPCGVQSFNSKDIAYHYCGRCHRFLDDAMRAEKAEQTKGTT
jgi:hypothetical protein